MSHFAIGHDPGATPSRTSAFKPLKSHVIHHGRAMGAGSGKGKGSAGGVEAPNTLQSKAIVTIIDLLSEGPIGGLVNGAQSIYFNDTPLKNSLGAYSFKGVTYQLFLGTPDQGYAAGFPAVQNTIAVSEQITNEAPVEFTVTNTDCTRATVTLDFPALLYTDTHNGDINPTSVQIAIDVTPADDIKVHILTDTISGKCTSTYERSYTFALPGTGPWSIFVTRITPDSTTANLQNATYLGSVDEIIDYQMLYSDCAYMALTFDSEFFGATVPVRTYDLVGVQINVPLNYDPVTRTYATTGPGTSGGTWDGVSYQQAATDNPAFIALDLVTNNRYGCGLPASSLQYTKWDLYTIAQYCDGLVPDGFGGMEPRYTCNIWMSNRDDAYRVLQTICSIWRGMTYWGAGSLRFTADMPAGISQIVNQADVIDGNFTYEGTSLKSRHTLVIANYLDPTNYWQPTPIVYQDPELTVTSILGPNILSINAIGCTTAGQAYRQGNWLIAGEQACTETVTYKAGLDHLLVRPGDIIAIHDPAYAGVRFGGRILATGTTLSGGMPALVIELDQVLTPEDGEVYTLDFELTDGTLAQGITVLGWIQNTGVTPNTTSALVPAPTGTPTAGTPNSAPEYGALWLLMSNTLVPRQFRIIGVTIPQRGQVEVTALLHDPDLYAEVEQGIDLTDTPYTTLPNQPSDSLGAPSSVTVNDYFVGEGSTTVLRTTIGWSPASDYRVKSYDIEASSDTGYTGTWNGLAGPSYDIDNLPIANYVFAVRSEDGSGNTSPWVYSSETAITGNPIPPPQVTALTATGGLNQILLQWQDVGIANLLYYEIWRAPVIADVIGAYIKITEANATSWTDTSAALTPLTTWAYEVRAVNTLLSLGDFSTPATAETTQLGSGAGPNPGPIAPGAVSTVMTATQVGTLAGSGEGSLTQAVQLVVPVPNGRTGIIIMTAQQGLDGGEIEGGDQSYHFQITQDSGSGPTTIYDRTPSLYVDSPVVLLPVSLGTGSTIFTVNWGGAVGVSVAETTLSIFVTAS